LRSVSEPLRRARSAFSTLAGRIRIARSLTAASASAASAPAVVDAVFALSTDETTIAPLQVRSELIAFAELVRAERPRHVLEIGTSHGGTLYVLAWAAAPDAVLVSADVTRFSATRRWLYRSFARRGQTVTLICGDSHSDAIRDTIADAFGRDPIDVLFIDGDHSYDGVRRDFELYTPLVRPGGLVAFHDIVDGPEEDVGGVPAFWRETRSQLRDVQELVESASQGGYGIGIGRMPTDAPDGPR
jgi:predicted O-methyltransferase YrrM